MLINGGVMPITGQGWEMLIQRLVMNDNADHTRRRTYGTYQVFLNGQAVQDLSGNICESKGPGDNSTPGNGRRIAAGTYPLSTQFGEHYKSVGYTGIEKVPMPGVLLMSTGARSAILIHPGHLTLVDPDHPPDRFLASVGCLNPTGPLEPTQSMNFQDSQRRVIALIDSLHAHAPHAFQQLINTPIPNASIVIKGEPMTVANPAPAPLIATNTGVPDLQGSAST